MPEALELPLHVADIGERGDVGRNTVLDRGVLRRHAEGVPAEGMQDVVAPHTLRTRHHVADDVVADVPDMRVPGRVREHLQTVELAASTDPLWARRPGCRPSVSATWRRGPAVCSRPRRNYSPRHRGPWAARTAAIARAPRPVSFCGAGAAAPAIVLTVALSDPASASRSYPPSVTISRRPSLCLAAAPVRHETRYANPASVIRICASGSRSCASNPADTRISGGANASNTGTTTRSNTAR